MPHRYFCNEINSKNAYLRGEDAHHLITVMRARQGETVVLCDGKGTDYCAKISQIIDNDVTFDVLSTQPCEAEPTVNVTLYIGYPKLDKLEFIIQKATELGAVKIVPFFSKFCVTTPKKEDAKNLRYQKIAKEAAKQSSRGIIPEVLLPLSFTEMVNAAALADISLFCYENGGSPIQSSLHKSVKTIAIITGSEGGFSEAEAATAIDAGLTPISLGSRILRCETAPIAALSCVMAFTGNLE